QEVEGGGGSGGAGDAGGFVLVGQQQGGGVEQVVREGLGGGGGEDDGDAGVAGGAGGGGDGFHRQLQLEQERLGGGDDGAFGFGGAGDGAVRAGDDDDRVAALVVDHDVGEAARAGDPAEEGHVDAGVREGVAHLGAEGVLADRAEERHFGARAGGGDGLVGALAAGHGAEVAAGHGLAQFGGLGDVGDQVHVGAAEDGDHWCINSCVRRASSPSPMPSKPVRLLARLSRSAHWAGTPPLSAPATEPAVAPAESVSQPPATAPAMVA